MAQGQTERERLQRDLARLAPRAIAEAARRAVKPPRAAAEEKRTMPAKHEMVKVSTAKASATRAAKEAHRDGEKDELDKVLAMINGTRVLTKGVAKALVNFELENFVYGAVGGALSALLAEKVLTAERVAELIPSAVEAGAVGIVRRVGGPVLAAVLFGSLASATGDPMWARPVGALVGVAADYGMRALLGGVSSVSGDEGYDSDSDEV